MVSKFIEWRDRINKNKKSKFIFAIFFSIIAGFLVFVVIEFTNPNGLELIRLYSNLGDLFFDIVLMIALFYLVTLENTKNDANRVLGEKNDWASENNSDLSMGNLLKIEIVGGIFIMFIVALIFLARRYGGYGEMIYFIPVSLSGALFVLKYLWRRNIHPVIKIALFLAASAIWSLITIMIGLNFGVIRFNIPIG